jgi:hypothetical protein
VVVAKYGDHLPLYRHVWMAPASQGKRLRVERRSLAVMCPASVMRSTQTAGPDGSRARKASSK